MCSRVKCAVAAPSAPKPALSLPSPAKARCRTLQVLPLHNPKHILLCVLRVKHTARDGQLGGRHAFAGLGFLCLHKYRCLCVPPRGTRPGAHMPQRRHMVSMCARFQNDGRVTTQPPCTHLGHAGNEVGEVHPVLQVLRNGGQHTARGAGVARMCVLVKMRA